MVTFTATIDNTSGTDGTPTGSVEFFDGTTDLGAGTALSGSGTSATSTFSIATLSTATQSISAVYEPTGVFETSTGAVSQSVNPAVLTITAVTNTKPYDGTTSAAANPTYQVADEPPNTLYGSDTLTNLTETYDNPNVGTGKALSVAGYTISDAGNYTVTLVPNNTGVITAVPASASFVYTDASTEGNWINTYGTQGYDVLGGAASLPSYATVNPSGETTYTWAANTTDPRALEQAGGASRIAAAWYATSSFSIDVNINDGNTHDLELYFLDWNSTARSEQVQISNGSTGLVLDTETVSSFHNGIYLEWAISGNVLITITKLAGYNAVLSGLFFGPAFTGPASATYVEQDASTEGNWINSYGTQGYDVLGGAASLPSYATVTPSGQSSFTWTTSTTDPRALEQAGGGGRIDAVWYATNSFSIDVDITDGNLHDLELYFLDVNSTARSEQVQITSATTGMVLDTETVSSFHNGVYLEWDIERQRRDHDHETDRRQRRAQRALLRPDFDDRGVGDARRSGRDDRR